MAISAGRPHKMPRKVATVIPGRETAVPSGEGTGTERRLRAFMPAITVRGPLVHARAHRAGSRLKLTPVELLLPDPDGASIGGLP